MNIKLLSIKPKINNGFTLIELMISLVIGLIIIAAIITMYIAMIRSNSDNLKSIRLNQDLRSLMSLMNRDIRRAGANRNAAADVISTPPTNPFSDITSGTRFTIDDDTDLTSGNCITYSYDSDEASELYGFRLGSTAIGGTNIGTVETRANGALCSSTSDWQTLSDPNLVNITQLQFLKTPTPNPPSGPITIEQVEIRLTGELRQDSTVTRTIVETVKIRNEEF